MMGSNWNVFPESLSLEDKGEDEYLEKDENKLSVPFDSDTVIQSTASFLGYRIPCGWSDDEDLLPTVSSDEDSDVEFERLVA